MLALFFQVIQFILMSERGTGITGEVKQTKRECMGREIWRLFSHGQPLCCELLERPRSQRLYISRVIVSDIFLKIYKCFPQFAGKMVRVFGLWCTHSKDPRLPSLHPLCVLPGTHPGPCHLHAAQSWCVL